MEFNFSFFEVLIQQYRANYTTITKYTNLTELVYKTHLPAQGQF